MFFLFAASLAIALITGIEWIGQPLRLVQVVTLVAVGMAAGVSLTQAVPSTHSSAGRCEAPQSSRASKDLR